MSTERNNQLLAIGKQCSHPSCLLVDFLPFKCHHCEDSFCQEHFKVTAHSCSKYDESNHNRVAPDCPLCNTPVAIRPGQDPNDRMEEHFNKECSVMTGKSNRTKSATVCARGNCKKVLFSPIRCNSCKNQFCPTHRFPADHNCTPVIPSNTKLNTSPFAKANTHNLNVKALAAGTATMDAIKKTMTSASAPTTSRVTTAAKAPIPKPSAPSSLIKSFSKADRLFIFSPSNSPQPTINLNSNVNNDTNVNNPSATNTTIPTSCNTVPTLSTIVDYNSFVPRPIFASA